MKESLNRLIQKKNSLEEQYDEALLRYENSSALPLYQQDELYEMSDATMKKEIENYCGREVQTPYEVALKYGKLYEFYEIPW